VLDASRSVTVAGSLLSQDQKKDFLDSVKKDYVKIAADFAGKRAVKHYLSYSEAVANKTPINWKNYSPPVPTFLGVKPVNDFNLAELKDYIDWQPFFIAWEMHGKFPQILSDALVGKEATKLYNDANKLLDRVIAEKWLRADGAIGFWHANSNGKDTVTLLTGEAEGNDVKLEFLRQQSKKADGQSNISLADFVAPADEAVRDHIGAFAVTIHGIEQHIKRFESEHDDYNKIMLQALADRLAEAFAEKLHERVRKEYWAYAGDEQLSNEELIREEYTGIRPAPGYPACPDHTEKRKLFALLDAGKNTGIQLTESLAMYPASSVCGWYFSHPESKYFGVGKIMKDQVEDYASRKKMSVEETEKWLKPILEYD
jgi:5-methyltetrahydrofolate--homocysteine methyltransferase